MFIYITYIHIYLKFSLNPHKLISRSTYGSHLHFENSDVGTNDSRKSDEHEHQGLADSDSFHGTRKEGLKGRGRIDNVMLFF